MEPGVRLTVHAAPLGLGHLLQRVGEQLLRYVVELPGGGGVAGAGLDDPAEGERVQQRLPPPVEVRWGGLCCGSGIERDNGATAATTRGADHPRGTKGCDRLTQRCT